MASTYRDRTAEFRSVTETLKRIGGIIQPPPPPQPPTTGNQQQPPPHQSNHHNKNVSPIKPPSLASRSEFNKKASRIGHGVHETSQKISRLAQLAKRSSMFDDPIVEIQELTAVIKTDITALNTALSDLQTLQNMEMSDGNYSDDRAVHSTAVCDDLKGKLMAVTKRLQVVLTARTENIKAHENRKQIFSANRENPFLRQPKQVTEPPPWSNPANAISGSQQESPFPQNGIQVGNQLRRRPGAENTPSQHMEMSMLQQVVPRQENYSQSRAVALQNVESTISELGGIFTHLATMVAQQGELAIRIDDNMDESLSNVENARSSLLKHLNSISSNRWLMIKIFAIVILFLVIFIFFVA